MRLLDGEKSFEDMNKRLDRIPACDGRTDRRLATPYSPRYAMHTRRAVITSSAIYKEYLTGTGD